ncbi:MAG TPA: chaperonin [Firmicutes bacterium]|jgi:archaeal chaperonin|nr:chaperonin [Bacillota bacterium]
MSVKDVTDCTEVDQYMAALVTNCGAIRAITEAVQGTLGPKGLDCMLVDPFGGIMVTNDGVTILKTMDVNHPAARILISAAEYQEKQVGDGTTTATIIAGTLVSEGVNQVLKGVPVIRVIEGIRLGVARALEFLAELKTPVEDLTSPILHKIALIAAREHHDLANLVIEAARIIGPERLIAEEFKLADQVIAIEGSESALIRGTIINRMPMNPEMPRRLQKTRILIIDDALEPLKIDNEALTTETGFNHQLHKEQELIANIKKIADLGIGAIFADRFICDFAEDLLTDLGIIGVQGVSGDEWHRLAEMTGARPIKRGSLSKPPADLEPLTGEIEQLVINDKFRQIRIFGKPNQNYVTMIAGANTKEVVGEKERIMKDAASALQAAWLGGAVPGGGSAEMSIARRMNEKPLRDMAYYGYHCVIEALKKPLIQICTNAGFNPLEKVAEVLGRQEQLDSNAIGVNCDTGAIEDLSQLGIWDPYLVKYQAIKTAGEVGEAILRINMIIKMKEEKVHHDEKT